ncbi:DMT family transporter [Sphingomonas koreensis]|nr:DMT family transporter [Sphingomonas koreensis]
MHPDARSRKSSGRETDTLALAALIVANVALAFGPWFVRLADVGPVATGFWRIALAVPLLLVAAFGTGWRPIGLGRALWIALALGGVCFAADLASWHIGILRTTLANATLFGNSATLFYPIYGFFLVRALPSRVQALALVLAAIGAALLMGKSYELSPKNLAGDLLCLLAGLLYTGYFILMARARLVLAPLPALALSSLASVLPLLLFALVLGERIWPQHWGPLIGVALASQVLGQGMMIYALGKLSPLVVGIALLTQPIVAGAIGWLVYGETLGMTDLIGAVLVAVALVLVRRRVPALAPPPGETRVAA